MRMTFPRAFIARAMLVPVLACILLASCATGAGKYDALQRAQYNWSAAIRWGDFEGAWNLVDPGYREKHPMSELGFERYRQIQVSHYRDGASETGDDTALRDIDIGVINRHTMAERGLRYREAWRWDPEAKTWWVTSGLPDFWQGE